MHMSVAYYDFVAPFVPWSARVAAARRDRWCVAAARRRPLLADIFVHAGCTCSAACPCRVARVEDKFAIYDCHGIRT